MSIQFVAGQILFVGGEIAMHADCCCDAVCPFCEECIEPCTECWWLEFDSGGAVAFVLDEQDGCCWGGRHGGGCYSLSFQIDRWELNPAADCECEDNDCSGAFDCANGGVLTCDGTAYTLTPCLDCEDCPPA